VIAHHARRNPGTAEIERMARVFAVGDPATRKRRVASAMHKLRAAVGRLPPPKRPSPASWHQEYLNGEIAAEPRSGGSTITAARVERILAKAGERHVLLTLTSPGGKLTEAEHIASLIESHRPGVTVRALNWAASAAVVILAAASHREAFTGTRIAFHDAGVTDPPLPKRKHLTAARLRQVADMLDTVDRDYVRYVSARCRIPRERVQNWKAEERTMTAEAAHRAGLVHEVVRRPQKR
jgi:ATP-dependent protease ClpP protease subunit